MLKIKANSKNIRVGYRNVDEVTVLNSSVKGEYVTVTLYCKNHGIQNGKTIILKRNVGDGIEYTDNFVCTYINKDNFSITYLNKYEIYPQDTETGITYFKPILNTNSAETINYDKLLFNEYNHIFIKDRSNIKVKSHYYWKESGGYIYDGKEIPCSGDCLVYDSTYLVRDGEFLNITGKTITAITISNDKTKTLNVNIVPSTISGIDNRKELLLLHSDGFSDISNNLFGYRYYCEDTRFFENNTIQPNVSFYEECGNIKVIFGVGDDCGVDLFRDDAYTNGYVEGEIEKNVEKIVNYERYPYEPVFYDGVISDVSKENYLLNNPIEVDKKCKNVDKIEFNLNFRRKKFEAYDKDGVLIPESAISATTIAYYDFGGWETDDKDYWNNYILKNETDTALSYRYKNITGNTSDLLGWLGFVDDDIYYQKSTLKKSFLRLSFYDSPNRQTQKLLFYSTVFFDSNSKFSAYINSLKYSNTGNTDAAGIVFSSGITGYTGENYLLTSNLFCTSKYDNSISSDGFYLHLFDKTTDGNQFSTIYMKIEFNNAKTGKIIPLINPVYSGTSYPIEATSSDFPINYVLKYNSGGTYVGESIDMKKLTSDMYTKILVKYNYEQNRYIWMLPTDRNERYNNNVITFNLYEPRLYGFTKDFGI